MLSAARVAACFDACQTRGSGGKEFRGIAHQYTLNVNMVKEFFGQIKEMLLCLPKEFHGGFGDYVENAAVDSNGEQWGKHIDVERLLVLGMAAGLVEILCIDQRAGCATVYPSMETFEMSADVDANNPVSDTLAGQDNPKIVHMAHVLPDSS